MKFMLMMHAPRGTGDWAVADWKPEDLNKLSEEIAYSEAGITVRETKDLWSMPAVFLALLLMRATEWLLRRKWGVV